MTLTLDLAPEIQAALTADAQRNDLSAEEFVAEILRTRYVQSQALPHRKSQNLDDPSFDDPTLALFAQWNAEDATDDPEEIARRERDKDELQRALQDSPLSLRRVDVGEDAAA